MKKTAHGLQFKVAGVVDVDDDRILLDPNLRAQRVAWQLARASWTFEESESVLGQRPERPRRCQEQLILIDVRLF